MPNGGTNWLDVLRTAMWPIVALIILLAFWGPISRTINDLEDVKSFKAGPMEVTFDVGRARRLPDPSPDVARALQSLSARERDALLSAGTPRNVAYCSPRGFSTGRNTAAFRADPRMSRLSPAEVDSYVELAAAYERLAGLRLATVSQEFPPYVPKPVWCEREFFFIATTLLGDQTRAYLLSLINAGIEISPSD